jgi:hypothetical protein
VNDTAPPDQPPDNPPDDSPNDRIPQDALATDSAGLSWTGRELTSTGFDGDLGEADASLLAALDYPQDETALMRAVTGARLLVPIVAVPVEVPNEVDISAEQIAEPSADNNATDMAVMTLTASDGQRAFPVFSSMATLAAWDAAARPSPVTSARAAQGAVAEGCDVLLLDCGSAHERLLRPSMVWALAQQRDWLPAHADPFVAQALSRATADEDDVVECLGEGDPAGAGILRVVLGLRPGLDADQVQALASRIAERIATDGEARARIDGLSFTIR